MNTLSLSFSKEWIEKFRLLSVDKKQELFAVMMALDWSCIPQEFKDEYQKFQENKQLEARKKKLEEENRKKEQDRLALLKKQQQDLVEQERRKEQEAIAKKLQEEEHERQYEERIRNSLWIYLRILVLRWLNNKVNDMLWTSYSWCDYKKIIDEKLNLSSEEKKQRLKKAAISVSLMFILIFVKIYFKSNKVENTQQPASVASIIDATNDTESYNKLYKILKQNGFIKWNENWVITIDWKKLYVKDGELKLIFKTVDPLWYCDKIMVGKLNSSALYIYDGKTNKLTSWPYTDIYILPDWKIVWRYGVTNACYYINKFWKRSEEYKWSLNKTIKNY